MAEVKAAMPSASATRSTCAQSASSSPVAVGSSCASPPWTHTRVPQRSATKAMIVSTEATKPTVLPTPRSRFDTRDLLPGSNNSNRRRNAIIYPSVEDERGDHNHHGQGEDGPQTGNHLRPPNQHRREDEERAQDVVTPVDLFRVEPAPAGYTLREFGRQRLGRPGDPLGLRPPHFYRRAAPPFPTGATHGSSGTAPGGSRQCGRPPCM